VYCQNPKPKNQAIKQANERVKFDMSINPVKLIEKDNPLLISSQYSEEVDSSSSLAIAPTRETEKITLVKLEIVKSATS
jgi:hypothetical protein